MNTIEIIRNSNSASIYQNVPLGVLQVSNDITNNNLTGISSLNGLSGAVLLTGAGEATVSVNGQIITVTSTSSASAATSGLATSGFCTGISGVLQNQVNILNNNTGNYYLKSNPSGYITGFNSGIYVTTGQTGQFYPASNPSQYVNSGNLYQTGSNLDNKINLLSGYSNNTFSTISSLQSTGSNLQNQINLINNNTGQFYLSSNPQQYVNSGNLYSTGNILNNKINSFSGYVGTNPSGYLNNLSGLSTGYVLGISGQLYFNFTGLQYNLYLTGSNLQTQINNLNNNTGNYYLNSNPSGFVGASSLSSYATNTYVNSGFVPKLRYNSFCAPAGSLAPLSSGGATATSVSFSNTHYFDVYSFDPSAEQGITFQFSLPDTYDNSSLKAKLFCGGASGAISGYVFGVCARAYFSGDSLNQSFGPETLVTGFCSNSGIIFKNTSNYINLTGNISGSDSLVLVKISRKVNDAGDVCNKAIYLYNTNMQWRETITEPQLWS